MTMIKRMYRTALLASATTVAFEGAGWKLDADGHIVLKDGNPVYVDAQGGEATMGADTISRLNGEAAGHRKAAQTAQEALKKFEGLDPEQARKAVDTVKNIDAKKLIDAGEVDKVKQDIAREYETKLAEKDKRIGELDSTVSNMSIDGIFNSSEFVRDQIAVPQDMFQATFRSAFKRNENGEIEAYGRDGNRLMSKQHIGEYAKPDEALRILVESHPQKDAIMKAPTQGGSGSQGGGGNRGQGNVMKRAEFNALSPAEQAAAGSKAGAGELTIVD